MHDAWVGPWGPAEEYFIGQGRKLLRFTLAMKSLLSVWFNSRRAARSRESARRTPDLGFETRIFLPVQVGLLRSPGPQGGLLLARN